ncbi:MAG: extracellular solute-binding protein [Anaerolineales bacterium]|nr:extracellular solute-binding protein [Anaerolineales bacterium]
MKKNLLVLFALLAIAALVLGACGGGAPADAEPAAEDAVTVRVWTHQNDAFNAGLEALAESYMEANPDVAITFETFDYDTYIQTLQTALPAGTEADILQMFGSWVCSYADGGNLATVPEHVLTMSEAEDAIFPAQLAGYSCDGALYGVPQEFNIEYGATLVNTAIAAESGVDVSNGWASWDEFIADAQAMTVVQDDVMLRAGYNFTASDAIPATFYSLILQNGGEYLTEEGFKVDTPEGLAALEFMKELVDAGVVDPVLFNDEENWVGDCYFEENCAMGLVGPWAVADYAGDYPDVVDVTQYVALPYFGSEPKLVAASGWGLSVSANSEVQEAAWDFVKYAALDADNAVQWNLASGTLPALKANATGAAHDELVAAFPHFGPFLDILQYAQGEGAFPDRDLVWYDISYPRIIEYLQGNTAAEETLQTIEREVNETLQ